MERKSILEEVNLTSERVLEEGAVRAEEVVDRAFLWLALCLAGFLLLGFAGGWVLIRFAKKA